MELLIQYIIYGYTDEYISIIGIIIFKLRYIDYSDNQISKKKGMMIKKCYLRSYIDDNFQAGFVFFILNLPVETAQGFIGSKSS